MIVGAGVSGLAAAAALEDPDYLVLDRDAEIGGYCKTVRREGFVWDYSGHFFHFKHPEISLPLVESIERIMIRAEVFWQTMPANRSLEHAAQCRTIHDAAVNTKPDDATCKLVHYNQNPKCSQRCRFAAE